MSKRLNQVAEALAYLRHQRDFWLDQSVTAAALDRPELETAFTAQSQLADHHLQMLNAFCDRCQSSTKSPKTSGSPSVPR